MIRYRDVPGLMIACAVGITAAHLCFLLAGCGSAQTHQSIELGAYAAEQGLCVDEAQDKDAGAACLAKVRAEYAGFWADGGAE